MPPLQLVPISGVDSSALEKAEVAQAVQTLKNQPSKWIPIILKDRCTACGDCLDVCGPVCLRAGVGPVVLTGPEACVSAGDCVLVCNDEAIRMAWVTLAGDESIGRWRLRSEQVQDEPAQPSTCGGRNSKLPPAPARDRQP